MKALIVLLALGTAAYADDRAEGEKYYRLGVKAYGAQNFQAAVENFDQAYKALPMPEIAFSAAQAYRRLYRVEPKPFYVQRAVELYRAYLDKVKTGGRVGDAADNLGEMERELDRLKAAGTKIRDDRDTREKTRLGINVSIEGANETAVREVGDATGEALRDNDGGMKSVVAKLDGKQVEPFALIDVSPGEHAVSVTADGYFPVDKKQRAVAGASSLIEVELVAKPAKIALHAMSGATVSVDGRRAGAGTLEMKAGKHLLSVTHRGREPFERELVVTRGQELTVDAPLPMTARRRALPWVLGTAGVLASGALLSGVSALVADSRASDLDAQIQRGNQPPSVRDDFTKEVGRRNDARTGALVLGGAALATAAIGALLYYTDNPTTRGEHVTVVPVAGAGGGGVSVNGRF